MVTIVLLAAILVTIGECTFTTKCPANLVCAPLMSCNDIGKKFRCAPGSVCCSSIKEIGKADFPVFFETLGLGPESATPAQLTTQQPETTTTPITTIGTTTAKPTVKKKLQPNLPTKKPPVKAKQVNRTNGTSSKGSSPQKKGQQTRLRPANQFHDLALLQAYPGLFPHMNYIINPSYLHTPQQLPYMGKPLTPLKSSTPAPPPVPYMGKVVTSQEPPLKSPAPAPPPVRPKEEPRADPIVLDPLMTSLLYGTTKEMHLKQEDIEKIPQNLPSILNRFSFFSRANENAARSKRSANASLEEKEDLKVSRASYPTRGGVKKNFGFEPPTARSSEALPVLQPVMIIQPRQIPWWHIFQPRLTFHYPIQARTYFRPLTIFPPQEYRVPIQIHPPSTPKVVEEPRSVTVQGSRPIVINMIQYQGIDLKLLEIMCQARTIAC